MPGTEGAPNGGVALIKFNDSSIEGLPINKLRFNFETGKDQNLQSVFSFGASVNPTSNRNRNVFPVESQPAECLDHDLYFFSQLGMAEVVSKKGSSLHGVVHSMTKA